MIKQAIPIGVEDINYIETGRYSVELGRSEAYILDTLLKSKVPKLNSSKLNTYCLFVNDKAYQKLKQSNCD